MKLFARDNWLKSPADRDVIHRWTVGAKADGNMGFSLALPPPPDPDRFSFLALGDSGDSEAAGPLLSPQDAVAQQMAQDSALPDTSGTARFILHMGDVVYMTGERRLYDRNFRRPYAPFLIPESTVDQLVFRIPFLPVPGNHDYYDLGSWARWIARVPFLGAGVKALTHELFAFSLPEGGSEMGRAYMDAFVDQESDTTTDPLPYRPGERTRVPNRYYKFSYGSVDFFALDSNTLDAPAPGADAAQIRAEAAVRLEQLETQSKELDTKLRKDQRALEQWQIEQREAIANDPARLRELLQTIPLVTNALKRLHGDLNREKGTNAASAKAFSLIDTAHRRWSEAVEEMKAADQNALIGALETLDEAGDEGYKALREIESVLANLPEGSLRVELLEAQEELDRSLQDFSEHLVPTPQELCSRLHGLSEQALDVQRELTLERRRSKYRPEDHDTAQYEWLVRSLEESERTRPDAWRIVYMHHPFYTSIKNHCERPDVQGIRGNLLDLLKGRVHLILSGHSHAFEWFRSSALPNTGLFVTGGGGQISLRPSLLEPRRVYRYPERYESLRNAGVQECAVAGDGPAAEDGVDGSLYHYLRVEVTPDALIVRPVGVRRMGGVFRREEPMPVFHARSLPERRPDWKTENLEAVHIRKGELPQPVCR